MPVDLRPRSRPPWRPPTPGMVRDLLELTNMVRRARGEPEQSFEEAWREAQRQPTPEEAAELSRLIKKAEKRVAAQEARIKAGGPYYEDEEE